MNAYETAGRLQKAWALEHAIVAAWNALPASETAGKSLAETVEKSPVAEQLWSAATKACGVNEPSDRTKELVIRGLQARERQMTVDEIFAGTS